MLGGRRYRSFDRRSQAFGIEHLFGKELLQIGVLMLDLLAPLRVGDIQAAELG